MSEEQEPEKMVIRSEQYGSMQNPKRVFVLRTRKGEMLASWSQIGPLVDEARLIAQRTAP